MGKLRRGFDDVESVVLFLGSSSSVQPPDVEEQKEVEIKDEISPLIESLAVERIGKRLRKKAIDQLSNEPNSSPINPPPARPSPLIDIGGKTELVKIKNRAGPN